MMCTAFKVIIGVMVFVVTQSWRMGTATTKSYSVKLSSRHSTRLTAMPENGIDAAMKASAKGKSWLKCRPVGVGGFAGQNIMHNDDFVSLVDTNDEWIGKRTGIRKRRLIKEGSSLRGLAKEAAEDALRDAGIAAQDIDLVIVATSSPDDLFGDAAAVAKSIGAGAAAAFDLTAACSGFLYGLVTGSQFIESGAYKKVLVIGADALTRFLDWEDRGTCILFGDGAGAMVLEAVDTPQDSGLLGFALRSDGDGSCTLQVPFKPNFQALRNEAKTVVDQGAYGKMLMNGPEVYKFAVSEVPRVVQAALLNAGLKSADVDWLLLHQANIRIMEHASKELGIGMDKVLRNIDEYGNTSAGSIPLALAEAVRSGKVKKGDIIAISGFGAGLNWGAAIIKWG